MFYKTYIGTPPQTDTQGNYQIPSQQIPCYGMKHFSTEYISPYPYPGVGRRAVIIAKYYEGAFINGSISCNNTPLPYVYVVVFDKFGIPHDNMLTDANGHFNLLAPAGNITLQFSYANEVLLKEITFNGTNNATFSPISEREAMRLDPNYNRTFNISIYL
jgi:dolichyl-diphosphooligosaccharide--protein glycosyltransferase